MQVLIKKAYQTKGNQRKEHGKEKARKGKKGDNKNGRNGKERQGKEKNWQNKTKEKGNKGRARKGKGKQGNLRIGFLKRRTQLRSVQRVLRLRFSSFNITSSFTNNYIISTILKKGKTLRVVARLLMKAAPKRLVSSAVSSPFKILIE